MLVVDDDHDFLDMVSHTLTVRGFDVETASDSDEAMTVCRQRAGGIHVLLADLSLPGDLSGGLARRVAAEYPDVQTIFVTGVPRYIALGGGLVTPDAPYLEKPISPDVLTSLIRSKLPQSAP
ncbi:hypothetical protein Aab01nite_53330 [Paractinoplanes abujensis]|uniref:DNA-binding response OmpR family regulator n=1 Tax=Paractinoplanes abujensis TaxID=882441 RepID=A0A7W7CS12_9ACTN|nr:response regulator [Actinoplanes abujensis]MBB4693598.1 DNA-binding response OmpR family regulator [Actinoplanes abujensis]GID21743.1 hypothetical protein Aab01nite_53330 [Actinoplanes abujensis]